MVRPLICHAETPARAILSIDAAVYALPDAGWRLAFEIKTQGAGLIWPAPKPPERVDGLWRTTCLEAFVRNDDGPGYWEVNLSPSGDWAAYAFDGYRSGMINAAIARAPQVSCAIHADGRRSLEAILPALSPPGVRLKWALSAVMEEADGAKSYWALAHPPGKPDFHHPSGFVFSAPV